MAYGAASDRVDASASSSARSARSARWRGVPCRRAVPGARARPVCMAQVHLPSLGESAANEVTVAAEKRLGEQIMREIRRDPDYLDDPVLLEYLQSIWQPLVAGSAAARQRRRPTSTRSFAWEPFLVRDRSVNAFALPGGYVGVHLALISLTSSGRRTGIGAGARTVARHAAPHRAQHDNQPAPGPAGVGRADPGRAGGAQAAPMPRRRPSSAARPRRCRASSTSRATWSARPIASGSRC